MAIIHTVKKIFGKEEEVKQEQATQQATEQAAPRRKKHGEDGTCCGGCGGS